MKRKLVFNKEAIMSLQEKQMRSLVGAEALMTNGGGYTSDYTCYPHGGPDSCCRKSCGSGDEYSVDRACEPPPETSLECYTTVEACLPTQ